MNARQRPQAADQGSPHPQSLGKAEPTIVRQDQIDIRSRTDGVDDSPEGMTPRERLDAYAQRFLDRLDNLMEKDGLTREQVAALQDAKAEFQQNIERFDGAFLDGSRSRDGIGGALKEIVATLRGSVQEALGQVHE